MFHQRLEIKSIYFARFEGEGMGWDKKRQTLCVILLGFSCAYEFLYTCVCMCEENESFIFYK